MAHTAIIIATATCLLFGAKRVDIGERMRLQVSPAIATAPAVLRINVAVVPHPDNRLLRVTADSGEFFRSSEKQLEGETSARVNAFTFREVPSGDYRITAELIVAGGETTDVQMHHLVVH